jgi:cytochrome oxidase Cu insertion factor (SCO1/SenC/PrrC family)
VSEPGSVRARNLRTVAALAALFFLPLALAFYAYYGTAWRPAGRLNHGTLINPPRPLPQLTLPRVPPEGGATAGEAFRGVWTLVYAGDGACDDDCRWALLVMRQTRLGLNNDMTRVARVWLATGTCCAGELRARPEPGLVVLDASGPAAGALLQAFPAAGRAHSLFVVDPLGNLMMSYDARSDPHGLLEDLRKLLRLSHIG